MCVNVHAVTFGRPAVERADFSYARLRKITKNVARAAVNMSFVAQRDHRINARRPPRWHEARSSRNGYEQ